jgi:preprotein translocase subunit SecA
MIGSALEMAVRKLLEDFERAEEWDRKALIDALALQFLVAPESLADPAQVDDLASAVAATKAEGEAAFHRKVEYLRDLGATYGLQDADQQVLSQVTLSVIDEKWKDHLYDLDLLRNAIVYRQYGQKDPLVEYKKEAFEIFEDLMRDMQTTFTERYLKIQVSMEAPRQPPPPPPPTRVNTGADELFTGPVVREPGPARVTPAGPPPAMRTSVGRIGPGGQDVPVVGRNDPCPCGSGKNYKKCHGAGG